MKAIKLNFKPNNFRNKNMKIIMALGAILIGIFLFLMLRESPPIITYKQANTLYIKKYIKKIVLDGEYLYLHTKNKRYKIYKNIITKHVLFKKYPIEVKETNIVSLFLWLGLLLGVLLMGVRLWNKKMYVQRGIKKEKNTSKEPISSESMPIKAIKSTVMFKDVAGIKDVKEELEEIIDFLRYPQKYRALDIRLPKGVLLVGPPGVGKTLISKAVAGEANVPFFYQSGASFVHIYVGMGAKRVNQLFQKAKELAPSIIFIDEIDAVGKSRGEFRNDEREATLNQLLTEMDGFEESSGVIVIGATNKIDVLDEALLRAGRFDRRIHISLPDLEERHKTLELYLISKPHEVDIAEVARMTVGFSFAAIDTLTNEAAIFAMREEHILNTSDFYAVKNKVLLGKKRVLTYSQKEREIQAIYQGAKAVIATWLDITFDKIGLIDTNLTATEHEILSRSALLNQVKFYLCGSIATEYAYDEKFSNASEDVSKAKTLVHEIIYDYAMSDGFSMNSLEEEKLLNTAMKEMQTLLKSLEKGLDAVSTYLLEHENITQHKCKEILREIF